MNKWSRLATGIAVGVVLAAGLLVIIPNLATSEVFGSDAAKGEVRLTRAEPVMAIEFEGSFETAYSDYLVPGLDQIRPRATDTAGISSIRREYWDGEGWAPQSDVGLEISGPGPNVVRFRWVIGLADDQADVTLPIEARLIFGWLGGSDEPPPDRSDVANPLVSISDIYPIGSD